MIRPLVPSMLVLTALTGCNEAPTSFAVGLEPSTPTSADEISVRFFSEARDINSDEVTYTYAWFADDAPRTDVTGPVLPAEITAKGETWRVEVTATDGKKDSLVATAEVYVSNTPPTASISAPDLALKSTQDLVATATATDFDGDEVEVQWYWTRDGEGTQINGPVVPSLFTYPGEIWVAHAVGFDGETRGEPATLAIEVLNGEPVIESITLTPEGDVFTDQDLVATVVATDPDDQPVTLTYTWEIDGRVVLSGIDRNVLAASATTKHDNVTVTVVADDSVDEGLPRSVSTRVLNTLPTAPAIAISPEEPIPGIDDMRCAITAPSFDVDGDSVSYEIRWMVDGRAYTGATTTEIPGDTVPATGFYDDESWSCTMVPSDDDAAGPAADVAVVPVTWAGPRTFTTCEAEGAKGPKQTDCDGKKGYSGTTLEGEVLVDAGIQDWIVPVDGTYRITARGAQGGNSTYFSYVGGKGAIARGDFELRRGDTLRIAVGQQGKSDGTSAGGGGGTWVMQSDDTPLLIAGGGGATGYYGGAYARRNGCDALSVGYAGRGGTDSVSVVPSYVCSAKTTDLGEGGTVPGYYSGNGGGGLNSAGDGDPYTYYGGTGGGSWFDGAAGGSGGAAGGFGGGGGGNGSYAAGGGGGYSGGDAGRTLSGGGGSYNGGANASTTVGWSGHGEVVIDYLD